jgi:beta-carotene 3-hydroxylase
MEAVAWSTHKYIMHGLLWNIHRDHHHRDHDHFLERNDLFFLFFSTPGIVCLYFGIDGFSPLFFIGLGITIYGFAYFFVHDIFIHQRFKIFRNSNTVYFKALRRAHKMHHKHIDKEDGECFGMLWVPLRYFKEARRKE